MSKEYDLYLEEHNACVKKGYEWMKANIPYILGSEEDWSELEWQICYAHDATKTNPEEYEAYDRYFYGNNRSYQTVVNFNYAWLRHIHNNPHHWQYWILQFDEEKNGTLILNMPMNYIIEMICDWWSFSWKKGNLYEIFGWYNEHKDYMKLSDNTRKEVERILKEIKTVLDNSQESASE